MSKRQTKILVILSVVILSLVILLNIGYSFAWFKDHKKISKQLEFGTIVIETNSDEYFKATGNYYNTIKPGDTLLSNDVTFNLEKNSEKAYVRAKYEVSVGDSSTEDEQKVYKYLKYMDLSLGSSSDYTWSEKRGDYYYLLGSDGLPLAIDKTTKGAYTFIKKNSTKIDENLEYNAANIDKNDININVTLEAVQVVNITRTIDAIETALNSKNNIVKPTDKYKVTFVYGENSVSTSEVSYGGSATIPSAVQGYVNDGFALWNGGIKVIKNGGNNHTYIKNNNIYNITENLILYLPADTTTYNVTFVNGTETLQVSKVTANSCAEYIGTTPIKTEEGKEFEFIGFSESENGAVVDLSTVKITADKTFYAVFKELPTKYNINYNLNGGAFTTTVPLSYRMGDTVTLPTNDDMFKEGCSFEGWYLDSGFTGTAVTTISSTQTGDVTLFAKWTDVIVGVESDGGAHNFATLNEAFDYALTQTTSKIIIYKDCGLTKDITIPAGKTISIVNGGIKPNVTFGGNITNNGTLTFGGEQDSLNNVVYTTSGAYLIKSNGNLTIYGGEFTQAYAEKLIVVNGARLEILGGNFVANNKQLIWIDNQSTGLIKNATMTRTLSPNKYASADLIRVNNSTLTLDGSNVITVSGARGGIFTMGTSAITIENGFYECGFDIGDNSTLTLNNGTIKHSYNDYAVGVSKNSSFIMNGGVIESDGLTIPYQSQTIYSSGNVILNGGVINATVGSTESTTNIVEVIENNGTLLINDITINFNLTGNYKYRIINNAVTSSANQPATTTIVNGKFNDNTASLKSNSYFIYSVGSGSNLATTNIYGGKFTALNIENVVYGDNLSKTNIYDGNFSTNCTTSAFFKGSAIFNIVGGTFGANTDGISVDGLTNNGYISGANISAGTYGIIVKGSTGKVTIEDVNVTATATSSVALNVNNSQVIVNSGTFNAKGYAVNVLDGSSVTLNNGEFTSSEDNKAVCIAGGATINGGTYTGSVFYATKTPISVENSIASNIVIDYNNKLFSIGDAVVNFINVAASSFVTNFSLSASVISQYTEAVQLNANASNSALVLGTNFNITFKNYDGSVLQTVSCAYGDLPVYSGETPTRETDGEFIYEFSGWSPAITTVTGNAEYTATYITKSYYALFPQDWRDRINVSEIGGDILSLYDIEFLNSAPTTYTKSATQNFDGITVYYYNQNVNSIAFVTDGAFIAEDNVKFNLSNLNSIQFNGLFSTKNMTNMGSMFNATYNTRADSLDLTGFTSENVTNFKYMFATCRGLKTLKMPDLTFKAGADYTGIFGETWTLSSIYLPNNIENGVSIELFNLDPAGSANKVWYVEGEEDTIITHITSDLAGKHLIAKSVAEFPSTWKTDITWTSVSNSISNATSLTKIAFEKTAPSGYTKSNQNINGIEVWYNSSTPTEIAFVNSGVIMAPADSSYLFSSATYEYLTSLTTLTFNNFNTSKVTDMSRMFNICPSLTALDVSSFNTSNVTNMSAMFQICQQLTVLNVSNFNTSKVTDMSFMFQDCQRLSSLDLSNFNTSNVTNMSSMFSSCPILATLNLSNFNTSNVTNMSSMFSSCPILATLNLTNFDTSKVTDMGSMFNGCTSLTSLDLSNFDTSKVTNMGNMFSNCSSLTSLDLSNFDTSSVTGMYYMFEACTSLTSLDLSNFNTSKVTKMNGIFSVCTNLTKVDISSFVINSGVNVTDMFKNCTNLETIVTPKTINASITINLPNNYYKNGLGSKTINKITSSEAGCTLTSYPFSAEFTSTWKNDVTWSSIGSLSGVSSITKIAFEKTAPSGYTKSNQNINGIEVWYNSSTPTQIAFVHGGTIYAPASSSSLFASLSSLTSLTFNNFNTTKVTDMSSMFSGCSSLSSLDLSNFDTSNVTNMSSMFVMNTYSTLDLSSFNTSKVTNMSGMFNTCDSLTSLNVSSFNTSNVINMSSMFDACEWLTSLDVSSFDTSKVTNMNRMFYNCKGLTSLDVSNFNTNNVTNIGLMFSGCAKLASLDLSSFNITSKCTTYSDVFTGCTNLMEIYAPSTVRALTLPTGTWYNESTGLESVDTNGNPVIPASTTANTRFAKGITLSTGWKTAVEWKNINANLVSSSGASDSTKITSLILDKYSNLTTNLKGYVDTGLDLQDGIDVYKNFTDSKKLAFVSRGIILAPTSSAGLFRDLTSLTTLKFVNFNTTKATSMKSMFSGDSVLFNLDISNFDTSKVTDMSHMLQDCSSLISLDLNNFNTSKVIDMSGMFNRCSSLTTLNTSSFDTSKVTDMSFMFARCSSLTNLTLFNTIADFNSLTTMTYMFANCSNLTTLTFPQNAAMSTKLTNMSYLFQNCSKLKTINVTRINTKAVTNMAYMFDGCSSLEGTLALHGNWSNNGVVASFDYMFRNCSSLTELAMDTITVSSSASVTGMFDGCSSLAKIGAPKTNKVIALPTAGGGTWRNANEVAVTQIAVNTSTSADYHRIASLLSTWKDTYGTDLTSAKEIHFTTKANALTTLSGKNYGEPKPLNGEGLLAYTYTDTDSKKIIYIASPFPIYAPANSSILFQNTADGSLPALQTITFANFDTSEVTKMNGMFYNCTSLTSLDLSTFNTSKVTNMFSMFNRCSSLTSLDLSNFDTSKVTDMDAMFNGCSSLTSLNLSSFNTSNVTIMANMFDSCSSLTSLNLSSFNTSNVTNTEDMFSGCTKLTTITGLTSFNTSSVLAMSSMFYNCTSLTSLTLSSFNTSKVQSMEDMFSGCSSLTSLDLSSFNPSSVIYMNAMFKYCRGLTTINFGTTNRTLSNLTTMKEMFYDCTALTEIRMGQWTTNSLTDCSYMFYRCKSLKTLLPEDLRPWGYDSVMNLLNGYPRFTTTAVTDASYMFYWCSSLEDVYGVRMQGLAYKNMSYMFYRCGIKKINEHFWSTLNVFATTNVTNFDHMFYGADLTELDLTSFTINNGANVTDMLMLCSKLGDVLAPKTGSSITIILPNSTTYTLTQTDDIQHRFWFKKGDLTSAKLSKDCSSSWIPESTASGTIFSRTKIYLPSGTAWRDNIFTKISSYATKTTITGLSFVKGGMPSGYTSTNSQYMYGTSTSNSPIVLYKSSSVSTTWAISSYYTIVAPASLEKLFDSNGSTNFDKLSSVAFNNIDTSEVTNMSYMFRLCTSLTSITGLSNFDTSKVTTMRCMFENVKVTSLDLSNFNTSKVTDIAYMFKNCSSLTSLNVSSFDTSLVTTMQETMRGLTSYTGTLDLSKWKIKKNCNMGDFMVDSTKISTFYTPCRIASSQDTTIGIRMKANYYDNYNSSNVNSGSLFYPDTVTHRLTKR